MKEFLDVYQKLNRDNLHLLGTVYAENVQFIDPAHEVNGLKDLTAYLGALYQNVEPISLSFHHAHEAYGGSKAAVAYMVETLRIPLFKEKINVSLICPGFVKTRLTDLNDFPMPFRITVQEASSYIRKGLAREKAEIHFPKRFTYLLKLLSYLPRPIWSKLAEQMVKV